VKPVLLAVVVERVPKNNWHRFRPKRSLDVKCGSPGNVTARLELGVDTVVLPKSPPDCQADTRKFLKTPGLLLACATLSPRNPPALRWLCGGFVGALH
jgi:hypothetical protein